MNGLSSELDRMAAEYVLGLLDQLERARAEALVEDDAAFQGAVQAWRIHFGALDETAQPVPVSDALWSKIEAGLGEQPAVGAATAANASRTPVVAPDIRASFRALWASLAFWRFAGLAGATASLALAIGLALVGGRPAPPILVAVLVTDANRPAAIVNAFADGHAELVPLEAIAVPPGRSLQIWTLWDRARGPVSLGLLDRARTMELGLRDIPKPGPNQLFEITLEPESGSPTGRPTGPVLMKGLTSQAL